MHVNAISWESIQARIWSCESCVAYKDHDRVQVNVRQQTPPPTMPIHFLFLGVAPPSQGAPSVRIVARSATNDPQDNLRKFISEASGLTWADLIANGAFLIHAVKCAIIPDSRGFQNPKKDVVDRCCPIGFTEELQLVQPTHILAFGGVARRAVLRHPAVTTPSGVGVSKTFDALHIAWPSGIPLKFASKKTILHIAPFPRSPKNKNIAGDIIREALHLAGLR